MKVKMCGLTRLEDTLAVIEAGADLLGFNFYPKSRRYIAPQDCAAFLPEVREYALRQRGGAVTLVGVFVNAPLAEIMATLDECGLHLAQLHGDEPPEYLEALGGRAFKALRPDSLQALERDLYRYRPGAAAPAFLLDACQPGVYGGSGQVADWGLAAGVARRLPILLAGGLTPDNVAAAIDQVSPWGVDVASGVESSPGRKDLHKMRAFIRQCKRDTLKFAELRHQPVNQDHSSEGTGLKPSTPEHSSIRR
jgi:phosphoribosylanthranilate isomerase